MRKERKGALELSIGTVVIIVLAMTMLILGMVLIRSIMCGAVNLVTITEGKVKGEIDKLFQSSGSEVVCIGAEEQPVTLVPGKYNVISCGVNAPQQANYEIKITSIEADVSTEAEIERWISGSRGFSGSVAPKDDLPKKILSLNIPKNAPHESIRINVEVYKEGTQISTQQLDFEVKNVGFFRIALC